jgi:thiol-disulfide isomerase/thioredoxin
MMRQNAGVAFTVLVLVAIPEALGQPSGGLKPRLDAIVRAQEEANRCYSNDLQGKLTEEAWKAADDRYDRAVKKNADEVLDLVRAHPNDPFVVDALKFVITTALRGPGDESYQAMEILLRDHVRDPGMGDLCGRIFHFVHAPVAESLLRAVLEQHPNRDDRGVACYTLGLYLNGRALWVRRIHDGSRRIEDYAVPGSKEATARLMRDANPEALEREAVAMYERVIAEFADVNDWWYDKRTIGAIADGELFSRRNLSLGKQAPEIFGTDHQGRPFALSDYRGKVLVLTFSANWCGPCRAMYPQERELVAKLKHKPFAIVSVNTDETVETLKKSVASGEITWRCWYDGGKAGPITTRWGVWSIPMNFVLDKAGVIRFKDVRDQELERAVAALLD